MDLVESPHLVSVGAIVAALGRVLLVTAWGHAMDLGFD